MEAIDAGHPPQHILGYTIRSRTRIYVSYLIPSILELIVYIAQIVADSAVSYQHFHTKQPNFGWATLWLILIPPILTFIFILSSRQQWANARHANRCHFIGYNLLQMLLFPFFAMHRIAVRIFWSIEALFHDDDDEERMRCLAKAEECSTCELYHLIQAYGQSAPQIILQLYHMLTQDLFRDFQTTTAQAICLVFSAIDLAVITTAYQRFESQHQVGRHYPWSTPQQIDAQRVILKKHERLFNECQRKKRESQRTITSFPESEKIMENFIKKSMEDITKGDAESTQPLTHTVQVQSYDEVDTDDLIPKETTVLLHRQPSTAVGNATDDDKIRTSPKIRFSSIREQMPDFDVIENVLDTVPDSPAPLPPTASQRPPLAPLNVKRANSKASDRYRSIGSQTDFHYTKRSSNAFNQFNTIKNMLIVNAQLFIKHHVPHPPKMLISRVDDAEETDKTQLLKSTSPPLLPEPIPVTPQDVVDFFMPRPTRIVDGIHQDDFAGKTIAFFGWICFIIMRMLSLATFSVFYPKDFLILISVHFSVMLLALILETKFKAKLNRTLFYMLLAYVYIFVLVEFRIKFKRIRIWYIGFFLITITENIVMTVLWYVNEEFESWWFGFIFEGIIYSGILFVATIIVYYFILKPKNVTLVVDENYIKPDNQIEN